MLGIILYRGFCLGYTIGTAIKTLGIAKGILFVLLMLLPQNIIFIPAIISISVSGIKLYKSILKNKNRENVKIEILRHTLFSGIAILFLVFASIIEIFLSTNLLKIFVKYF